MESKRRSKRILQKSKKGRREAQNGPTKLHQLSEIFGTAFLDSQIHTLITRILSLTDLQCLGAVSKDARAFVNHRQTLEKRRNAVSMCIRQTDITHPRFQELWTKLARKGRGSMQLRQANEEFKIPEEELCKSPIVQSLLSRGYRRAVPDRTRRRITPQIHTQVPSKQAYSSQGHVKEQDANIRHSYQHFLAQKDAQFIWLVLNGLGELVQRWVLDLTNADVTADDFVSNCTLSLGDDHWLAALFVADHNFGISVFCNGRPVDQIAQDFPRVFYYSMNMQLHEAWDGVYLLLRNRKLVTLFKLSETEPYETVLKLVCDEIIGIDRNQPFPRSLRDDTICFSFFERTKGGLDPPGTWLVSLVLEKDGTASRVDEEIQDATLELGDGSYEMEDTVLLGTGATFLALLLRPRLDREDIALAMPYDANALNLNLSDYSDEEAENAYAETEWDGEYFRGNLLEGTPGVVMLMVLKCNRWIPQHSFRLFGTIPCDPFVQKWLRPEILDQGLAVEDFVSSTPWLAIDRAMYQPPLI